MTMTRLRITALIALALATSTISWMAGRVHAVLGNEPPTQDQQQNTQFLRLMNVGGDDARLETSEITFRNEAGVTIRLVSVVHVGEQAYYDALMAGFRNDEAVLYEMIKPRGMPPARKARHDDHAVTRLQLFLRDTLGLVYQLDAIDYRLPNFVHADLDSETFESLQKKRNESMASLMLQSMTDSIVRGRGGGKNESPGQLLALLWLPDTQRQYRLMLAREMHDLEAMAMGLDGPNGSVILRERNKKAMEVLEQTLQQGKQRISIFYGAAHMPDLARRLEAMGFTPVYTTWHKAWDLTVRKDKPSMLHHWFGRKEPEKSLPAGQP